MIRKQEEKNVRKSKGITLIALVITIIVLLILAGVSIATLSGDNGILNQASTAKDKTKLETAREKLQVEVAGSYGTEGKITIDNLNKNLPNVEGIENFSEIKELPTTVEVDGYPFDIDEKGNITLSVPLPEVTHTISPETQVQVGEKITITITATPPEGETITKIIKPDGTVVENANETTYEVEDNDEYKFIIEASNGGRKVYPVKVTNGRNVEKFSDIYEKTEIYTDKNGKTAKIPAGFAVGKANEINTIDNGLVITDQIDSNHLSTGNEFVWIPVDGKTIEYKKHGYVTTSVDDTATSIADTGNGNWKTYYYRKYSDWTDSIAEENKASVAEHGGFYVARYEAGVPNNANFYASKAGDTYYTDTSTPSKNVTTYRPVSKANNQCWNYISQENSLIVASKMYKGSSSVKSQLIDGYAWDAIATWMGNDSACSNIHADSTNYGNYYTSTFSLSNVFNVKHIFNNGWIPATQYQYSSVSTPSGSGTGRVELATGALDSAKLKNIYDFIGNMWEWTTETGKHDSDSAKYAVLRGGSFSSGGTYGPVSYRGGYDKTTVSNLNFGFRVALYL